MPDRLTRLLAGLSERGCDAALLVGGAHAAHLLGYQCLHSGPSALLLDGDGRRTLLVPAYELPAAERESGADAVLAYGDGTMGLDLDPHATLAAAAADALRGRRVGVAGEAPGVAEAAVAQAGGEAVAIGDVVAAVRLVKDPDELARIAHAYRLCLAAQDAVRDAARAGASELELYTLAHATVQRGAGRVVGFGGDMLLGARTALVGGPLGVPSASPAAPGDVVLADLFAEAAGYWGATGRTTVVGEHAAAQSVCDSIAALLDEVAARVRAGMTAAEVYALVADGVRERHPDGAFDHHAGHGVGVEMYEPPFLVPSLHEPLPEGTVLTLEPGVYFAGRFGVRRENTYVLTGDGARDLIDYVNQEEGA